MFDNLYDLINDIMIINEVSGQITTYECLIVQDSFMEWYVGSNSLYDKLIKCSFHPVNSLFTITAPGA